MKAIVVGLLIILGSCQSYCADQVVVVNHKQEVKMIAQNDHNHHEQEVNKWLKENPSIKILSIKFQAAFAMNANASTQRAIYATMIVYTK